MRVPFSNRVLEVLGRLYGIVGSIGRTSHIDVGPPILVHDVSREVEAAQGFRAAALVTVTTAGAGVAVFATTTRDAFLAAQAQQLSELRLAIGEVDVWVLGCTGLLTVADAGDFGFLTLGLNQGDLSGGTTLPLATFESATAGATRALVNGGLLELSNSDGAALYGPVSLPALLPDFPGSVFAATGADDAGGAMTAFGVFHCWVCAKGTFPPGL